MTLLYVVVGMHCSNEQLYSFYPVKPAKQLTQDAFTIASKIKCLNLGVSERSKLKSAYGDWFVSRCHHYVYAVCVQEGYPERVAFQFIQEIKLFIKELTASVEGTKTIHYQINKRIRQMNQICQKYQEPKKIDKVKHAQYEVELLQGELHEGIKKIIDNQEDLECLGEKTERMKNYAALFQQQSETIEKAAFWKKWKCYFILGGAILGVFLISGIIAYKYAN